MPALRKIISKYMYRITWILITVIVVLILIFQLSDEQRRAYEDARATFSQIEQVLEENQRELEETQEEYRQTCLHNAEIIARIIESDPDVLNSAGELKQIAASVEVDEIHVFDAAGRIFTGTHPEYYGYSFDSGEQMMFFKPMLEDRSLALVQDIMPNTAKQKLMQYSAVWSSNGEFIVQVGMEPVNVMKVTQKNELSYIFSLFRVNLDADYYAIDAESGTIAGSTDPETVGCDLTEAGFDFEDVKNDTAGFHAVIGGRRSFCVFKRIGSNYIGRVVSVRNLYQRIPAVVFSLLFCLIIVTFFLARGVTRHMDRYVVDEIHGVIKKLKLIADGNLEETVDVKSSIEFVELGNYINTMVKSLLDNNRNMSYVLNKTNLRIGTYGYNSQVGHVRFTEFVPKILSVDTGRMKQLASDTGRFQEFLDGIRQNPAPDEQGVYQLGERYIRLEEIRDGDEVFGVAIDVTSEWMKRREIEMQRDLDALTGLYNRRGLDLKLSGLFREPEKLGYSAVVMIDADGLKGINDVYGHEMGDIYLKKIAGIFSGFGTGSRIAARQGGDEFVLFLYHYETREELTETIETLGYIQTHSFADLSEDLNVPLRFSFGYCLADGSMSYQELIKEADKRMYKNKVDRKGSAR